MDTQETNNVVVELRLLSRILSDGLKELKTEVRDGFRQHNERMDKHEQRINALESKSDRQEGGITVIRVLVGASFLGTVLSIVIAFATQGALSL